MTEQVTTKQVKEWGSEGYAWKGQRDQVSGGGFMCVKAPEMTDRDKETTLPVDKLLLVDEVELMKPSAPAPSGLVYAGGPAKEPA